MIEWNDKNLTLDQIIDILSKYSYNSNIRRYNSSSQGNTLFLKVNFTNTSEINELQQKIQLLTNSSTISISEINMIQ